MSFDEDDGSGRAETAGGDRFGHRLAFSVAEVAEVLGISRAHAYQLVADGQIPSVQLGRRRLVARAALVELLRGAEPVPRGPSGPPVIDDS